MSIGFLAGMAISKVVKMSADVIDTVSEELKDAEAARLRQIEEENEAIKERLKDLEQSNGKRADDDYYFDTKDRSYLRNNTDVGLIDEDWMDGKAGFILGKDETPKWMQEYRFNTLAASKFMSTSLGSHVAINMPYSFTRYADIRPGFFSQGKMYYDASIPRNLPTGGGLENDIGMGRYYSDAIDDNAQVVYFEFGVPRFNGLIDFFTRAIDRQDVIVANRGQPSAAYTAGRLVGNITFFLMFPWTFTLLSLGNLLFKFMGLFHTFDYYYMEPKMSLYYGMANQIANRIAVEMGILSTSMMEEGKKDVNQPDIPGANAGDANKASEGVIGLPVYIDKERLDNIKALLPNLIGTNSNYIDIFGIATRAQALNAKRVEMANQRFLNVQQANANLIEEWKNNKNILFDKGSLAEASQHLERQYTFEEHLKKMKETKVWTFTDEKIREQEEANKKENEEKAKEKGGADSNTIQLWEGGYKFEDVVKKQQKDGYFTSLYKSFLNAYHDGGAQVCFHTSAIRNVTTSFSNSTSDIGLSNTINQVGGAARDFRFSLGGYTITGGIFDNIIQGAKDFAMGHLDAMTGGLTNIFTTLAGYSFVNIPKMWKDSSVSLPGLQFSFKLRSPYGGVWDRFQSIMIPLSLFLAGSLPKATGEASYTSPFLCSCYLRGVRNIKLGIISELSITSAVGTLAYTKNMQPLAIDVSMTVTDLSPLITVPVTSSIFDGAFKYTLNDQSALSRFISSLTGRSIYSQSHFMPKLALGFSMLMMETERALNPNDWGSWMGWGILQNFPIALALSSGESIHKGFEQKGYN